MDILTKFDPKGRKLWSKTFIEIVPFETWTKLNLHTAFGTIYAASDQVLYVRVTGWPPEGGPSFRMGLRLDSDGKFIKVLPGYCIDSKGRVYNFVPVPGRIFQSKLCFYDLNGELLEEVQVDREEDEMTHFQGVIPTGLSEKLIDPKSNIYLIADAKRSEPIEILPQITTTLDIVINKYDSKGNFLKQFRVPFPPFLRLGSRLCFDDKGNFYYPYFTPTEMQIIRYHME